MIRQGINWLLLLSLVFSFNACSEKTKSPDAPVAETAEAGPIPSWQIFFRETAQPYAGTVLRGITENTPPSVYVRDVLAPEFEALTGIKIEFVFSDLQTIERIIANGGRPYDFVYVEQDLIYEFLADNNLVNLTQTLGQHPQLVSPDFDPVDFTSFIDEFRDPNTHDLFGIPIEAFLKVYVYRRDLFEDPDIQAAFAEEYNYPLAPAITVEQYRNIAAFFTRYGQTQGLDLWGTTVTAGIFLRICGND